MKARLGFVIDSVLMKRSINAFILMSDRVSKELSASAKCLSDRECFIEVYIDNRSLFDILYSKFY
jgi:hypothetical protein